MHFKSSSATGVVAIGATTLLLAVAACTGGGPQESTPAPASSTAQESTPAPESPDPSEGVSQACASADRFADALVEFRATLKPESSLEQIRMAREKVTASFDALVRDARDLAQDRVAELEASVSELRAAVAAVPDDSAVPEAIVSLRDEADDVRAALQNLRRDITC
ncbi:MULTISPECIES: hypothetical protein [Micrococcaceae]|uniref:hypothetical protein n=1 Tax=Micrococcaceae TaxID=1268 RepID=UPI001614AE52|nr:MULTISPECIES: hypothetical protein [Micrococcaceae]MBB5750344.1 glucose/arabinose dehydrogenase [Micrococcus sp. TA1]HRO29798.1 hypothetical protein [Citricoccus sp.]HRO94130.1 hypothetical protein [Citricoccus sp.]